MIFNIRKIIAYLYHTPIYELLDGEIHRAVVDGVTIEFQCERGVSKIWLTIYDTEDETISLKVYVYLYDLYKVYRHQNGSWL